MSRAAFQILVFPFYHTEDGVLEYAIFKRADAGYWQGIAGGGEEGEIPLQAARREAWEEAGVPPEAEFIPLDSMTTIPAAWAAGMLWGEEVLVVPEYSFGARLKQQEITLSHEHTEYAWVDYQTALDRLKWDSNRAALWELNYRLRRMS
ncbi:MAG TPA: NUDIX domain-containing protein [Anaerolineaceae bacterium]|nr:NUDIX domain-containing protein [Anaerolineaceae bacterium]